MNNNLVICLFVLDSEKNENIRKNDIKKIKVLVDQNENLPSVINDGKHMRTKVNEKISSIIGTDLFHTQQVCAMAYDDSVDIVYVGATNIENIKYLDNNYQLVDFKVENNNTIIFGEKIYNYKTVEIAQNNNIIYKQIIDIDDETLKRKIKNILLSYKRVRVDIDTTDVIFKFMPKEFTLEDVRILYEIIKDEQVDKSNFRKKIAKYCRKIDKVSDEKSGYRPSQKYEFVPLKGDVWL